MIRKYLFWPKMKKEVVDYLACCIECQQVKAEHQYPVGLLQPLPIPEWKWEIISMDFIKGLSKNSRKHDSIMIIIDKLSKEAHFIPVKYTYKAINITYIFYERDL